MMEPDSVQGLPRELVDHAKDDFEFAARLLHVDTRKDALAEVGVEPSYELDLRLGELANMSLREGLAKFAGEQQVQP